MDHQHTLLIVGAVTVAACLINYVSADDRPAQWEPRRAAAEPARPRADAGVVATPVSVSVPGAFSDDSLVSLVEVAPSEIAAAEQRAFERHGHVFPGPARLGFVRALADGPLSASSEQVRRTDLDDGRLLYTFRLRSPDAYHMRLHFTGLDLGESELRIFGVMGGEWVVRGPYTSAGPAGTGDFWAPTVPGDTAWVEIVGVDSAHFTVAEVAHFDHDPLAEDGVTAELGCHIDVNCVAPPVDTTVRDATGNLVFVDDGDVFGCTGTILADLDPETFVPYFLSADHCLNEQEVLDTLQVTWRFQTEVCGGSMELNPPISLGAGGAMLYSEDAVFGNDAAFMRLGGLIPETVAAAGWNANEGVYGLFTVHHPGGTFKRWTSLIDVDGDCFGCACYTALNYDYHRLDEGVIEGGSSGAGSFNSANELTGQMFGTCVGCPDFADYQCDNRDDYCIGFGDFEHTYDDVAFWLHLGGTIHVDDSNADEPWDGSATSPYRTVGDGLNAVWSDGLRLLVHTGNYPESLLITRNVRIEGIDGAALIGG